MADPAATLTPAVTVACKIHATDENTPETIDAASAKRSLVGDVPFPTPAVGRFERAQTGQDLEREPGRPTTKRMELRHTEEILANITAAPAIDPPFFDAPLRASGHQAKVIRSIQIDAPTGAFTAGEVVSDNVDLGSATKTAVLVSVETDGSSNQHALYVVLSGGDFAVGETVHGDESSASAPVATGASAANAGHLYHPLSESTGVVPPAATTAHFRGGKIFRAITRGDAVIRFQESNPGAIEFTLSGPVDLEPDLSLPNGSPPAGIETVDPVAPLATGGQMIVDVGGDNWQPPIIRSLELRVGNTVSDRPTITGAAFENTGFAPTRIRQRQPVVSFDPEDVDDATHDIIRRVMNGAVVRFDLRYGDWLAAGGAVALHVYAAQYDAPNYQDREGVMVAGVEAPVRRGPRTDWPYYLAVYHEAVA